MKFVVKFCTDSTAEHVSGQFEAFSDAKRRVVELVDSREARMAWVELDGVPEMKSEFVHRLDEVEFDETEVAHAPTLPPPPEPETLVLSPEAIDKIADLLENPPEPTPALVEAVAKARVKRKQ